MRQASRIHAFGLASGLAILAILPAAAQDRQPNGLAKPQAVAAQKPPAPTAQPPAPTPPAPPAAAGQPPEGPKPAPGWASQCMSNARQTAVDCAVEQTAVVTSTGQLVASIVVRVPHDSRQPMMMIQVPVGLYLPAGVNIQVDDNKPMLFTLQTCDAKGCYAGAPLPQELLAAMKTGKKLAVIFQNMQKETIAVPLPLENFADSYQKIQ
ncbi:MAG TPA: invasion associated locus B family protein [Xanthobacteraceae bacterium]|nr:invasion associated locus B family protein [Xanthobacteraceae bacterium]